jgi:hypothetical protein
MTINFIARRPQWLPRLRFRQRGNVETWIWGQPVILVENEVALTWLFTIIVRWYA